MSRLLPSCSKPQDLPYGLPVSWTRLSGQEAANLDIDAVSLVEVDVVIPLKQLVSKPAGHPAPLSFSHYPPLYEGVYRLVSR